MNESTQEPTWFLLRGNPNRVRRTAQRCGDAQKCSPYLSETEPVVQGSLDDYTSIMPRRSEEPPDSVENLAQEVQSLSREIQVLRETLDEIREYMQWITRNADQFQIVVIAASSKEDQPEPVQIKKTKSNAESQGSLFA